MPQRISNIQPPPDWQSLIPEEQQLFGKYVHDLRKQDKWMTLEEAQRRAYQMVLYDSLKDID
jgi:hypothetical protein